MRAEYLLLGEILRPQGIKGEVKIKHYTDDPARFSALQTVYFPLDEGYTPVRLLNSRNQKDDVFLLIEGVSDRDEAEKLRGKKLYVRREDALPLEKDEYFIADLLGASVVTKKGEPIGTLKEIFPAGGADVYRVKTKEGMLMFPALQKVIVNTDVDKGIITLDEEKLAEVGVYEDRDTDHLS